MSDSCVSQTQRQSEFLINMNSYSNAQIQQIPIHVEE